MSTYSKQTKHPITGEWHEATWIDDFYGRHRYGVQFPDGGTYNPDTTKLETRDDKQMTYTEKRLEEWDSSDEENKKIFEIINRPVMGSWGVMQSCRDVKDLIQQAEQEVMKRVVEEIEHWTPKQERGFYVGGVRAMTLDDHKRNFSREILQAVNSPKITNLDKVE